MWKLAVLDIVFVDFTLVLWLKNDSYKYLWNFGILLFLNPTVWILCLRKVYWGMFMYFSSFDLIGSSLQGCVETKIKKIWFTWIEFILGYFFSGFVVSNRIEFIFSAVGSVESKWTGFICVETKCIYTVVYIYYVIL